MVLASPWLAFPPHHCPTRPASQPASHTQGTAPFSHTAPPPNNMQLTALAPPLLRAMQACPDGRFTFPHEGLPQEYFPSLHDSKEDCYRREWGLSGG